ncbi:TIGR01777 family oxidoreductase [Saccharopolyspora sp. TS4A08]|uniref:TIGR01777 family oxidoreductase n=1 Tax=Saccharopolyspora ipomoeae TaxID=3042027 RepID=A0ABT6PSU3_9PSEU|nr:TIGR01777 family oxidoreductase [Saccharopolyspora sp. TS4A08]MDI2031056.1 TIGR01777 family oxidoreductase [Saccharopolyspora sp. TS4A08]
MRVVVAGSSGLIGTSLVAGLRQAEHEVVRLVRRLPAAPDERGWDPGTGRLDADALEGADAVVNLSGPGIGDKRWSPERKRHLLRARVRATEVLANAVAEAGVPVLANASAVGFYGDTGSHPVTEASPPGTDFLAMLCRRWEAATAPAADAGARVVLLRTGLVISPSGGLLGQLRPLFSLMLGGRLGSGSQYMPWISLDDEVAAIRFALENPEVSGPVNLTGPAPVTNTEFTRALGEALGRPAPWIVPGFALRIVLGEFANTALTGQRAMPTVLEANGFGFQHPTLGAALAAATGK